MLRIFVFSLFSLSLYAIGYPALYSETAAPLFKTRVQIDPLVSQASLRQHILKYEAHSDRVLGKYRRVKSSSSSTQKEAYRTALKGLEKSHSELKIYFKRQLKQSISTDNYTLFLALISIKSDTDYLDPYLREKIYTYYSAHRQQEYSCYLDRRMKKEWDTIASYYPSNGVVNYEKVGDAYYREVILLSTERSPYSAKVRGFLKDNNVKFTEHDIEKSEEGLEKFEHYKGTRIPLLVINNRVVEGYNEYEMDKLLRR